MTGYISTGRRSADEGLVVSDPADLAKFAGDVGGHRFSLTSAVGHVGDNAQNGANAYTGPAVALAITWRASTGRTDERAFVYGGGKTLYNCETGQVIRALLAPSSFSPIPPIA
ncbi:MAG: hypothetical protein JWM34_4436 [Ilumatobacteraceae bacterium]|nr:hypothetical protein [Ilumatobacteraceae bacterium]